MQISRDDRTRMERAHVHAWPALRSANIDGWLWRSSGGASQRANSVSTLGFHGVSPEAAIADAEARYEAAAQPSRFHTFEETSPPGLADMLQKRGYRPAEPTITMFKRIAAANPAPEVETRDNAWNEWRDIYLGEISPSRRVVNALILDRIPRPRAFFGYRRGAETVATALCVVSFGCAVIECVATRADARRQGVARALLIAAESWAAGHASEAASRSVDYVGLQVLAANEPAIALYRQLGFVAGAANRFWQRGK